MARASGAVMDGLMEGSFTHAASGVRYRIFERDGAGWLSYARPETAAGGYLNGEVKLAYFIGSNTRGRTYLFERDGYWFETPVNWYAKKRVWDMAPNFLDAREMPLTLPVDANCLHCHVSGVSTALPGARNHFAGAPFAHGGIGCASCHGDAAEHLRTKGKAAVLNPGKLDAALRDSVCLQCHLEGETAVYRLGHSLADYRPGEALFDSVAYFVHQRRSGTPGARDLAVRGAAGECLQAGERRPDDVHDVPRSTCEPDHGDARGASCLLSREVPELPQRCEVCDRTSSGAAGLRAVSYAARAERGHCARAGDGPSDSRGERRDLRTPKQERDSGADWE